MSKQRKKFHSISIDMTERQKVLLQIFWEEHAVGMKDGMLLIQPFTYSPEGGRFDVAYLDAVAGNKLIGYFKKLVRDHGEVIE